MTSQTQEAYTQKAKNNKRLKTIISVIVTLILLIGVLFAIGINASPSQFDHEEPSGVDISMASVVDSEGRSVSVPVDPQRIAIMDSFSGELAIMIGAGDRICGIPNGVKSDVLLQNIYPDLNQVSSLSGNSINTETLLSFECDVAIVKASMSEEERAKLDKVGIPYVVVGYSTIEEQMEAIRLVGDVCGESSSTKAQELVKFYQDTCALVSDHTQKIAPEDIRSIYHAINDSLLTDSATSLGRDWIELAGCKNVSVSEGATHASDYSTTIEQIYSWDPDVVICNAASTAQEFLTDEKWAGLRAVSSQNIHTIPTGATRWGQRGSVETYLALVWLGTTVYPEYYTDVDLQTYVTDYYQTFLGITITDELYQEMLSGSGLRIESNGGKNNK